jgi:short-subunit dehydrogenase
MNLTHPGKKVFLTGASSGIGKSIAQRLISEGYEVWGTSRQADRLSGIAGLHVLEMDLSLPSSIESAWKQGLDQAGHFDIIIQNAGYGHFGSIEETSLPEAQAQWSALVEGPLLLCRLAAAHCRLRRRGWIIGISSLAAEMPLPFFAHYSAGKAAFSSLLGGLWMELKPFGVHVVDLRPGDIRTNFNQVATQSITSSSPYGKWSSQAWKESCRLIKAAPDPEIVSRAVLRLLKQRHPPAVLRCGSFFQSVLGSLGVRLFSRSALLRSIRSYYQLDRGE